MKPTKLSIILKITIPSIICILLVVWSFFFLILPEMNESLMKQKKEKIKDLTQTVYQLVNHYHERVESGELSRAESQKRVLQRIDSMRYGPEKKDYFWVNDMTPVMLMHPYQKELIGEKLSDYEDPEGKKLFV